MDRAAKQSGNNAAAQRGLMVQRVLVDGWSAATVAASYHVDARQVVALVAAYQREGMASLRDEAFATGGWRHARLLHRTLARLFPRIFIRLQNAACESRANRCVELARRDDDARRHQ